MKASTFQTLIVGLLCLAIAGLSGGLYNQYQRVAELHSTNTQYQQTLDTLQRDSNALKNCLLYTSPSPRDRTRSRMPSSA